MVRFGRCSVDVQTRVVERDGDTQHLEPQAFDLLVYLLAHSDRVVPKAELLDGVWGDQFVSESALTTRIKEVRQALGDDGSRQAVIKNYRGRGYRFVADIDVEPLTASAVQDPSSSGLVGRDIDVVETAALLEASRLVTFVGPGGVGKTTLAQEVARQVGHRHPDGVRVVRLAPVADSAGVVHVLRRDTGLLDAGSGDDAVIESLAALDSLVVLDNCEHVLDEVGRLVAQVLACDGPIRLLATSRERLGVAGEQLWPVAPLDSGPARELLLARARLVHPGFSWSPDVAPDVDRILYALDRLPLAIEMAAAWLPALGVPDLANVLTSRLDLLRSADRTAVDRHRTIDALIGWSESLLTDAESELLATMSIFAGPATVTDLAAIAGAEPAELAVGPLVGLVDKSLAVADTSGNPATYRLLETVRTRASRQRPAGVAAIHARYITDAVAMCDRLIRTADEPSAARRLDALTAEIRAAHAWARSHDPGLAAELTAALLRYSYERPWAEPAEWAGELAERLDSDDPAMLNVAAALAADASNRGNLADADRLARLAVSSADPRVSSCAHITLADTGIYAGDVDDARQHASALVAMGERSGDTMIRTLGVVSEVLSFVYAGQVAEGQAVFDRRNTVDVPSPTSTAWIAYAEGELHAAAGRLARATEAFRRAVELGTSVGSHFIVSVSRVSSLAAETQLGDARLDAFLPLLHQYRRTQSLTHGITTLRNLVEAMFAAGRIEPAMVILGTLSNPGVKSTYGAESDRVDAARNAAVAAAGEEVVAEWMRTGAEHDAAWALDHAIDILTTELENRGRDGNSFDNAHPASEASLTERP